jgi:hypothetical protein
MKIFAMLFAIIFSMAVFARGADVVEKAPQNYLKALKSGNPGLVESTLFHVVKFKLFYPGQDTQKLEKQAGRLVTEGGTRTIRYKAYLACEFLKNEDLLVNIEKEDYKDGDIFFKMLADELENLMLVTR